jgi:hypothetical protein
MKRIGTVTLALAVLLAAAQTGTAGEKQRTRKTASAPQSSGALIGAGCGALVGGLAGESITSTKKADPDDAQLQELIKILNETKSPMTLVATTVALVPLGDKAKPAVPAILRNAERLKVLEDLGKASRKGELAAELLDAIFAIQSGWTPDNNGPNNYRPFSPVPRAYVPATPVTPYSCNPPAYCPAVPPMLGPAVPPPPMAPPATCPAPMAPQAPLAMPCPSLLR